MLHHQAIVGCDVRFALYSVDNHALSLSCWWRCQLDKGGETSTTHTYYTGVLYTLYNLLGSELGMSCHQFKFI